MTDEGTDGDGIWAARRTLGLTQAAMADALGLENGKGHGRRTISDWENGRRKVPGPVKLAVLHLLDQRKDETK